MDSASNIVSSGHFQMPYDIVREGKYININLLFSCVFPWISLHKQFGLWYAITIEIIIVFLFL